MPIMRVMVPLPYTVTTGSEATVPGFVMNAPASTTVMAGTFS